MSSAENRKSPRVNAPHVLVKISSRDRFRSSYLKDLSEGGLFVKTDKALPAGAQLVIDLLPPGWTDSLRLKGVVVRGMDTPGNAGMAVRFEGNEESSMEALRTLVNDYNNGASPPEVRAEDAQEQLQRVLGQVAELKNSLEKRENELTAEKARREEATKRAVLLTAELEIAKDSAGNPGEISARLKELETELATSQHEEMELRTRLAEVEGELEAFKHENETLEQDDSTSRRLAASLAKEKADLTTENGKLTGQLNDTRQKLKDATALAQENAEAMESQGQNERHLTEKLREITTEVDDLRMRSSGLEMHATELETELTGTKEKLEQEIARNAQAFAAEVSRSKQLLERTEQELVSARGELAALTKRATSAETAAKEATTRADRSRTKERELRDLMAMVTGKPQASSEESVVFEERNAAPAVPPPPASAPVAAQPIQPPPAPASSPPTETDIDLELPPMPSMPSVSISFDSLESSVSAFQEASSTSGIELTVDVDVDEASDDAPETIEEPAQPEAAEEAPPADRAGFERRLRGNEPLGKTEKFDTHTPRDDRERSVLGLLQAGGRFSELMVLGRGVVAPAELIDALFTLCSAGAIRFEEPKK